MIKEKRVNYCLIAICALCLCLWGGIYDFTIAIYGCIFCIGIITVVRKKDRLSIPVNITSAGLIIILICSIISSVAARDHGIAVIGILRIVVFIVFPFMVQYSRTKKRYYMECFTGIIGRNYVSINCIIFHSTT